MIVSKKTSNDYSFIQKIINKENNPFLKKSRTNNFKKLREIKFNFREEYKYTPLKKNLEEKFDLSNENIFKSDSSLFKKIYPHLINNDKVFQIIIMNGEILKKFSNIPLNISFKNFEELEKKEKIILYNNFAENDDSDTDMFSALNGSLWSKGIFIHVNKNLIIDKPLIINNFYSSDSQDCNTHTRKFIFMEKNSKLSITEFDVSLRKKSFNSSVSEIILEDASEFDYFKIQNDPNDSTSYNSINIKQKKNSILNTFTFSFSGSMIRNNLNISLENQNCYSNIYGVYALNGNTHLDNHTSVDHIKKNSISNEHYKGIMHGKSNGVFNGKIFVRKEAQKTNAFQVNNNILLSDKAKINTKPQLEIWADDVKCSHGCTTGQLDEDAIFYLQSRGLTRAKAISILINAFFEEIIQKIDTQIIKKEIKKIVSNKIESYINE